MIKSNRALSKIKNLYKPNTAILGMMVLMMMLCLHSYGQSKGNNAAKLPVYKGERKEDTAAIKSYFKRQALDKIMKDSIQKNVTLEYLKSLAAYPDTVTSITISSSTLSVMPAYFVNFKHLQTLKLFRCKAIFLRDLFEKLGTLPELTHLDIVFSEKEEIPNNIYKITALKELNLSNNKLRKLPDSIVYLKNLTKLNLMHNPYLEIGRSFDKMGKIENLKELNFSFSQLDTLPVSIGTLKKVAVLNLSDNPLRKIPTAIKGIENLKVLNLDHCNLIDGNQVFEALGENGSLEVLSMNGCKLKMIPAAISNLKHIKKLQFKNNLITDISGGIQDLSSLEYLDVSTDFYSTDKNRIKDLPSGLGKCTKLQTLLCVNNLLKGLPGGLEQTAITTIDLSWNKMEKFPASIVKLTQLKNLNLSMNAISVIDEKIGNLVSLENFQMAGDFRQPIKNKISKIPESIGLCKNLKILNLRDHVITELPSSLFELKQLEELNLMDNLLTEVPTEIQKLSQLKSLNLKANELATIPLELASLKNLKEVNLAFNPKLDFGFVFAVLSKVYSLKRLDISYNEIPIAQVREFQKTLQGIKINKLEIANKVTRDEIMKYEEKEKK